MTQFCHARTSWKQLHNLKLWPKYGFSDALFNCSALQKIILLLNIQKNAILGSKDNLIQSVLGYIISNSSFVVVVFLCFILLFFHTDDGRLNQIIITLGLFLSILVIIIIIIGSVLYKKTRKSPEGKIQITIFV